MFAGTAPRGVQLLTLTGANISRSCLRCPVLKVIGEKRYGACLVTLPNTPWGLHRWGTWLLRGLINFPNSIGEKLNWDLDWRLPHPQTHVTPYLSFSLSLMTQDFSSPHVGSSGSEVSGNHRYRPLRTQQGHRQCLDSWFFLGIHDSPEPRFHDLESAFLRSI